MQGYSRARSLSPVRITFQIGDAAPSGCSGGLLHCRRLCRGRSGVLINGNPPTSPKRPNRGDTLPPGRNGARWRRTARHPSRDRVQPHAPIWRGELHEPVCVSEESGPWRRSRFGAAAPRCAPEYPVDYQGNKSRPWCVKSSQNCSSFSRSSGFSRVPAASRFVCNWLSERTPGITQLTSW